jgi:hypothetical protein
MFEPQHLTVRAWLAAAVLSLLVLSGCGGGAAVPPDVRVGVELSFDMPKYPLDGALYVYPVVEEVRGRWVRLKYAIKEQYQGTYGKERTYWVNFDTVNYYRVVSSKQ